jgi:hypothetical protein
MFLSNVLGRMRPRAVHGRRSSRHRQSRRSRARPLVLEALEDRCLLSSYSFTPIADNGPSSIFSLGALNQPGLNDKGTVMFHSALKSGPIGVFTVDTAGSLTTIARTDLVGANDFFLGGGITDRGTVSLGANLAAGGQAVFTGNGGQLTTIADNGSASTFSSFLAPAAGINNDNTVTFRAILKSGATGIFTEDAGQTPHALYVTGGQFTALFQPIIQRNGNEVSFRATLNTGQDGVFLGDGTNTTTIATTGGTYSGFVGGVTNDAGTVSFIANLTAGGQAIVIGDGTQLTTIADTTSGRFSSFLGNTATINDQGQVVFAANLAAGGSGIFVAQNGEVDEIIGTGDPLFGSTVKSFTTNPFAPRGLNDEGQLGFAANLADGRTVIVRADPLKAGVELTPSEPAPQLVGEPITWTAAVADAQPGLVYQFSVGAEGGPLHVLRDYSPSNSFSWTPMQEGVYRIKVSVKDGYDAVKTQSDLEIDRVDSRVTGSMPVVTPTANPLVALYSVPPGPKGTVHVEFAVASDNPSWQSTNELPSDPGKSTNFFVAGMLPNTTYEMRDVFSDGTTSSPLLFTTGSIPSTLSFPTLTVVQPPGPGSDLDQDLIYHAPPTPFATDLQGRVVWYYDSRQSGLLGPNPYPFSAPQPGGTILGFGSDRYAVPNSLGLLPKNVLREIDLAGDTVRETNLDAVNAQLKAMGHEPIYGFYHEAEHLPDGSTVVLGITERSVNINGKPTNYVGTMVLALDKDFQVTWAWDAFDHLDVNRGPVLGEIVDGKDPSVPTSVVPNLPAVDWLHNNSVAWSPTDGNLILSLRHQDWVIKIDYRNGAGDGHVVWRLGKDGDFTVNSTDPNPWFSHQHDVHYIDDSTIILFDNGNTRRASDPTADSRGQVWKLDEKTMTATLVFNADLGNYSSAVGAAQKLSNGNYSFTSGWQGQAPKVFAQTIEMRPDGSKTYVLQMNRTEFRSYRMRTLYEGMSDQLAGNGENMSHHGDAPEAVETFRGSLAGPIASEGGSANIAAALLGAGRPAPVGIESGASLAAALTASSRQFALPSTPTAPTPENVERLDQLFAAGLEDGTSLVLPRSKRNLLSFSDENGVDADF